MALSLLSQIPIEPPAPTAEDQARWDHLGLRIRMLTGRHMEDVERAIANHIDPTRRRAWGIPDLSSNVFKSVTEQMSCLYDRPPIIDHETGPDLSVQMTKAIDDSGLWPLMSKVATMVIGCQEYGVRVHVSDGKLRFRPVAPNRLVCVAHPDQPDVPVYVKELRLRQHPTTGKAQWTWNILDITDKENPSEQIVTIDPSRGSEIDVTEDYLGETRTGEAYPYRDSNGDPIVPLVLFHANSTGQLWNSFANSELVLGSLSASVLFSFYVHAIRDASWPQRYAVGAVPLGLGVDGSGKSSHRAVATDPASLLMFTNEGELQPQLGQFSAGCQPEQLIQSISVFEGRLCSFAGISPAHLTRNNGTPTSGYAVSVNREGLREAQRRFEPTFRRATLQLFAVAAALLNSATGSTLPEDGWAIRFQSIPLSSQERESIRKDALEKIEAGLMSRVDAYMELHPGITRAKALEDLQRIKLEDSVTMPIGGATAGTGAEAGAVIGDEPKIDADGNIEAGADRAVLNGAQVTAAQGIVTAVAAGELPRDSGLSMLVEFFGIPYQSANRIMGTVGLGFKKATPTPSNS